MGRELIISVHDLVIKPGLIWIVRYGGKEKKTGSRLQSGFII